MTDLTAPVALLFAIAVLLLGGFITQGKQQRDFEERLKKLEERQ